MGKRTVGSKTTEGSHTTSFWVVVVGVQALLQKLGNFVQMMLLDVVHEFPQVCLTRTIESVQKRRRMQCDIKRERDSEREMGGNKEKGRSDGIDDGAL